MSIALSIAFLMNGDFVSHASNAEGNLETGEGQGNHNSDDDNYWYDGFNGTWDSKTFLHGLNTALQTGYAERHA